MKKNVVAKKIGGTSTHVAKPTCQRHGTTMKYVSSAAVWRCTEDYCPSIALPRNESDGSPIVAEGETELMIAKVGTENRYVLRGTGNNVVHDITHLVSVVDISAEYGTTSITLTVPKTLVLNT